MAIATLGNLQEWLMQALVNPFDIEQQTIDQHLLPGAHINPATSLAIYQRSYILRLQECLAEQFPATRYALGEELFNDFMKQYLTDCPSASYTLFDLGHRFALWLEDHRPDNSLPLEQRMSWVDFLVELADYERELFRLFDAPGQEQCVWPTTTDTDDLLKLQPCLSLKRYKFPVAWYFHQVRAQQNPQFPTATSCNLVILRRHDQTTSFPVSPLHFRFLQQVQIYQDIQLALQDIAIWTQRSMSEVTQSWVKDARAAWIDAGFFVTK